MTKKKNIKKKKKRKAKKKKEKERKKERKGLDNPQPQASPNINSTIQPRTLASAADRERLASDERRAVDDAGLLELKAHRARLPAQEHGKEKEATVHRC
jgi:hypothetical protein